MEASAANELRELDAGITGLSSVVAPLGWSTGVTSAQSDAPKTRCTLDGGLKLRLLNWELISKMVLEESSGRLSPHAGSLSTGCLR